MKVLTSGRFYTYTLTALFCVSSASAQVTDVRKIQTSPICTKTIVNNTTTPVVDPTTNRIIPRFGSTKVVIPCKLSQVQRQFGAFFISNAGHTVNYVYSPDGSVIVTFGGIMNRSASISCTGCPGSVGIPTPAGTIGTSAQFSDCDRNGTCLCMPCPTTTVGGSVISTPAGTAITPTPGQVLRPNIITPITPVTVPTRGP